ncbi:hypothetical protein ACIA7S_28225 [Streptomyces sp. NPDC051643]|uniref:hypothetical protein n=1 Tax=Streptomyces sp. NPDC051643 TaxID=3365665 RepID=UPI00379FA760
MPSLPAGYRPRASRSARRGVSRRTAREQARSMHIFMGTTPRYEPARVDAVCKQHHRKMPCARCV